MFALLMVTIAAQPADDDHPYGHHKAEYFSSGFEGVLILGRRAGHHLGCGAAASARRSRSRSLGWGLGLSVVSSAMNGALAWAMLRKAREHRSMALEGDARHLFTDVWTSVGVVLGLLARGCHRLAVARPGGGHRRGAATSCAKACRWCGARSTA